MIYHFQVQLALYYIITIDHSSLLSFQNLESHIKSYRWLKAVVCSDAIMLGAARCCLFGCSLWYVEASQNICTYLQELTIWPQEKVILKNLILYKNVNISISESTQRPFITLSYCTNDLFQSYFDSSTGTTTGVPGYSWLQAGTECRSLSTAIY